MAVDTCMFSVLRLEFWRKLTKIFFMYRRPLQDFSNKLADGIAGRLPGKSLKGADGKEPVSFRFISHAMNIPKLSRRSLIWS